MISKAGSKDFSCVARIKVSLMKGKSLISATIRAWRERNNDHSGRKAGFFRSRFGRGMVRKQIVITAEKTETYVIRQEPSQVLQAFCPKCNAEIVWLIKEESE